MHLKSRIYIFFANSQNLSLHCLFWPFDHFYGFAFFVKFDQRTQNRWWTKKTRFLVHHRFRAISAFWHQNHNSQNPLLAILSQRWLRFLCFAKKMNIGEKSVFSSFRGHFFRLKSYFYLRSYFAFSFRFKSDKESVRTGTKSSLWPRKKLETARKCGLNLPPP